MRRMMWFGAGAAAALWARRRVVQLLDRYTPQSVRSAAADRIRRLGDDVRAAVADGRAAMGDRQQQLRDGPGTTRATTPPTSTPALTADGRALHLVVPPERRRRS